MRILSLPIALIINCVLLGMFSIKLATAEALFPRTGQIDPQAQIALAPSQSEAAATVALTGSATTTSQLSLEFDLDAVSSEDALAELSFWEGGGRPTFCSDTPYSFATPTIVPYPNLQSQKFAPQQLLPQEICVCGFQADATIKVALISPEQDTLFAFNATAQPLYSGEGVLQMDGLYGIPAEGLVRDYCYGINEISSYDFLPWEPLGTYTVAISSSGHHLIHNFALVAPDQPVVYYSPRLKGYVLAGLDPLEKVHVVAYLDDKAVGTAELMVDKNGTAVLTTDSATIVDSNSMTFNRHASDAPSPFSVLVFRPNGDWISSADLASLEFDPTHAPTTAATYYRRALASDDALSAIADLGAVLALDPDFLPAYIKRARLYADQEKYQQALGDLEQAINRDRMYMPAYQLRVELYREQGQIDLAITDLDYVIEQIPNLALAYAARAILLKAQGQVDAAISDYSRVIELMPRAPAAYYARAWLYESEGKDALARIDLVQAVQLEAKFLELKLYGNLPFEDEELLDSEAFELHHPEYGPHFETDPVENSTLAVNLNPDFALAYYVRAMHTYGEKSLPDLDLAIELDPSYVPAYLARSTVLEQAGNLEGTLADIETAINLGLVQLPAYEDKARLEEALGNSEAALADYTTMIELYPHFLVAYYHRGRLSGQLGDTDQAIADFTHIIEETPNASQLALYARARLYHQQGEDNLARDDLANAIELDSLAVFEHGTIDDYSLVIQLISDSASAYYLRATEYNYTEYDKERALADYSRVIELDPDHFLARERRAELLAEQGKLDEAAIDYTYIIDNWSPGNEQDNALLEGAYVGRADIYGQQDRIDQAIADYSTVLELNPIYSYLREKRAQFYEEQGKFEEAIDDYTARIAEQPYQTKYYYKRAHLYDLIGEAEKTLADYVMAIEKDEGAYVGTLDDYNRVIALAPDFALAYYRRGEAYQAQGEDALALADFERVLGLTTDSDLETRAEEHIAVLQPVAEPSTVTAIVATDRLNVRAGPGANYQKIGLVLEGQEVTVLGRNEAGNWLQIEQPQGSGWVATQYINVSGVESIMDLPVTE